MMRWILAAAFTAPLVFVVSAQPDHPDRIHRIPGLPMPPPSPWYSGYLTYEINGRTIHTHYVLVECEQDDDEAPLIYWSNGGPGSSSMFGLLTELGPLLLSELSLQTDHYRKTGIPTPLYNEYTWTKLGSILLFDAPAPVGFSYCDRLPNDNEAPISCGSWTDELASLNTYTALQEFYKRFPSYRSKDLYLTGESYAGIYIPTLARRIVQGSSPMNLKGFAVGDGCLGTDTNVCGGMWGKDYFYNTLFFAGHHQIPIRTMQLVWKACGLKGEHFYTNQCSDALDKAQGQVGDAYFYNIYDDCPGDGYYRKVATAAAAGVRGDYPCGQDMAMGQYLNMDEVKEAFHAEVDFDGMDYIFDYTWTEPTLENFYKSVNGQLRVLVYNGDTDPAINSFEAQNWTSHLGFDIEQDWRPWTIDGCRRMGGYVTRYAGDFDFLTIRGAGHMVPTYKPAASFVFLNAWLQNTDYPLFDPDCMAPDQLVVEE